MFFKRKIINNKLNLLVYFFAILIIVGSFYYFYSQLSNQSLSTTKFSLYKKIEKSNFKSKDKDKALQLVKNLPEVQKWLNLFSNPDSTSPSTGGKPVIKVDSEKKGIYTIHAYESLTGHNVTFNWFYINLKTGSIKDFFGKEY